MSTSAPTPRRTKMGTAPTSRSTGTISTATGPTSTRPTLPHTLARRMWATLAMTSTRSCTTLRAVARPMGSLSTRRCPMASTTPSWGSSPRFPTQTWHSSGTCTSAAGPAQAPRQHQLPPRRAAPTRPRIATPSLARAAASGGATHARPAAAIRARAIRKSCAARAPPRATPAAASAAAARRRQRRRPHPHRSQQVVRTLPRTATLSINPAVPRGVATSVRPALAGGKQTISRT
mmetsp:Transcript_12267/g.31539  ORF Transcript_12267/g.31539 Transcript_12267/m.31539 type:complete len:234 (+) Transcript_12267:38-739(+)